jgi:hypothetical protein
MKKIPLVPAHLLLLLFSVRAMGQSIPVTEPDMPAAEAAQAAPESLEPALPPDMLAALKPLIEEWRSSPSNSLEELEAASRVRELVDNRAPDLVQALDTFWTSLTRWLG